MLKNLGAEVRECYDQAEDCARQAKLQRDPKVRAVYLDLERRWMRLARNIEFAEQVKEPPKSPKRPN